MLDPRHEAVLILDGQFHDRTQDASRYQIHTASETVDIVFNEHSRVFTYGQARVRILRDPTRVALSQGDRVEVCGDIWESATEILIFTAPDGPWYRIFYRGKTGEKYKTYPASKVRIVTSATQTPVAADVVKYWRAIVSRRPGDDPLRRVYDKLGFIHPESMLGSYLAAAPIESRDLTSAPIFPFRCNLSQRKAVENGLTRSVSVIEGPPGTGKTETILNLIANIIVARTGTVGVVSFTNAAVDNVRDKLDDLGFGHVVANLGCMDKRDEFFARQATRNDRVTTFAQAAPHAAPPPKRMARVDRRLRRFQGDERTRAELRQEVDAYRLELQYFERYLQRHETPDLDSLPLLRRSSDRILDYLAESEAEHEGVRPGLLTRIRKYFSLDPPHDDLTLCPI